MTLFVFNKFTVLLLNSFHTVSSRMFSPIQNNYAFFLLLLKQNPLVKARLEKESKLTNKIFLPVLLQLKIKCMEL